MTAPTAGDITVHRCVVRVVRRGGWSWGSDPRGLVKQVVDALPELLATWFDEQLVDDGPDLEITEPVQVSVRIGQFRSRGRLLPAEVAVTGPSWSAVPVTPAATESVEPVVEHEVVGESVTPTAAMLLTELVERNELTPLLATLPEETLRLLLAAVLAEPAALSADGPAVAGIPAAGEALPVAIGALAAELARRSALPELPATIEELRRLVAVEPITSSSVVGHPTAAVGDVHAASALPFLLVGSLARTGYLDAIGPALAAADLLDEAPLFAAALAYQVLGAPERGWRRSPADNATAAAFAGCESVPDLSAFADRVRPVLPILDGVLALSVCRGHEPTDPLLVTGVDGGLLLVDAQGVFPIAWAPDVAGLLTHWEMCGRPTVVVRDGALPSSCLRDLAAAGAPLLTDARPLRGDPLRRLPWNSPLWTYGEPDCRLAAAFPGHAQRLGRLVDELFTARKAVPRSDGVLDRTAALAAALSLGLIAWTLWRDVETPDPVLALTRFADLDATVRFTRDAVRVRLPLGRRHSDLLHAGLLADVPDVVWLGGRTLTFSGG